MDTTAQLAPYSAITYITAGHGKATLVGNTSRYTYSFSSSDDGALVFVRLLVAPDEFQYIGFLKVVNNGGILRMNAGRKGNAGHPAFVALDWYLFKAVHNPKVAEQVEFWHEGSCGRCGRSLTVPLSIERGIGPTCYANVTSALAA